MSRPSGKQAASGDLERLRGHRNRATIPGIEQEISREKRTLARTARAVGGVNELWDELVSAEIRSSAGPVSLANGVLVIEADDAGARYRVGQWLRGGGESALVDRIGGLRKVVTRIRAES